MNKIVDNYLILDKIGEGQFTQINKAKHVTTGELVAVKIFDASLYDQNPQIQAMISEEIEALSRLKSPHIIDHLRYLRTSNNMYEVYDLCEHGDLNNMLAKHETDFNLLQSLFIFKNLVSALQLLHEERIIHRDIKPENIFLKTIKKTVLETDLSLKDQPELASQIRYYAVLGDFGLCRILEDKEEEIVGSFGSPMYMSPECLQGMSYGLQNDLYSLGIVLYEMVCGKVPYNCNSAEELVSLIYKTGLSFDFRNSHLIPQGVKNLILRLTDPNPATRISHSELFDLVLQDPLFLSKYSPLAKLPAPAG